MVGEVLVMIIFLHIQEYYSELLANASEIAIEL